MGYVRIMICAIFVFRQTIVCDWVFAMDGSFARRQQKGRAGARADAAASTAKKTHKGINQPQRGAPPLLTHSLASPPPSTPPAT